MYDFPDDTVLQAIIEKHYESDKAVASICHGVSGLLNVKLSGGEYLIKDKKITGFSWFEESLAGRKRKYLSTLRLHSKREEPTTRRH